MTWTPMFAEVADKEPAITAVWWFSLFFCAVAFGVGLVKGWKGIVCALFVAAVSVLATVGWVGDEAEGPAILRELGPDYYRQGWIAGFLPVVFAVAGVLARREYYVVTAYVLAVTATVIGWSQTLIFKFVPPLPLALWFPLVVVTGSKMFAAILLSLVQFPLFATAFAIGIRKWPKAKGRVAVGIVAVYVLMAGIAVGLVSAAAR